MNYYKALEKKDRKFFYCEGFRKFVLGRVVLAIVCFFQFGMFGRGKFEDEDEWIVFE